VLVIPRDDQPPKNGDEVTDYGNTVVTIKELAGILKFNRATPL
jgi:hypothetical protein